MTIECGKCEVESEFFKSIQLDSFLVTPLVSGTFCILQDCFKKLLFQYQSSLSLLINRQTISH